MKPPLPAEPSLNASLRSPTARCVLVLTLIADTASLIPGSIIIDSDRAMGMLYLHFLDCDSEEKLRKAKAQVYYIEELLIRTLGSHRDLAALRARPDPLNETEGGRS